MFKEKWTMCVKTNGKDIDEPVWEALKGADVLNALSKPRSGTVKREWISGMEKDSIVFACANPVPEIWPWEAKKAGARIVATGRSDFPNQVNNSLGFPGIFSEDYIIPAMDEWEVCPREATAVGMKAVEQGIAQK